MKKTAIATALSLSLGTAALTAEAAGTAGLTGVWDSQYIFTMFSPGGGIVGTNAPNEQAWTFDFDNGTVSLENTTTFFGSVWTAHDVTFTDNGDGTYGGTPGTANMLFDWSASTNIPVEIVWEIDEATGTITTVTSFIQATSSDFPLFQPFFDAGPLTILCGDFFAVTTEEQSVDVNIATDLLSTCDFLDGIAVLDSYTQPTNGTVTDDGILLTYLPNAGFGGLDSFTYTAKDDTNTALAAEISVQVGGELQGNFTMMDSNGDTFGGTNDVVFNWDGVSFNTDELDTDFTIIEIKSDRPQPFFGFVWVAHHTRVYDNPGATPRTLTFDTTCTVAELESGMGGPGAACDGPFTEGQTEQFISMTIAPGQIGAHILFDWSSSTNIDVVNVWEKNAVFDRNGNTGTTNKMFLGPAGIPPAEDAIFELVSTDVNGDSINSSPMIDGPFLGFYSNFSNKPDRAGVPPEPFVHTQQDTELGSGILASMNIVALFASLMMLVGLRHIGRKK